MKITKITLDGEKNGIIVELPTNKSYKKFVNQLDETTQKRVPRLFRNYKVAKTIGKNVKTDAEGELKFFFMFDIPNMKQPIMIPFEDAQKVNKKYEAYLSEETFGERTRLVIEECDESRVMEIGYIVFDNGDTVRSDKAVSVQRSRNLFDGMCQTFAKILCSNKSTISSVKRKGRKEIVVRFRGTTAEIHVLVNSKLMDINQDRHSRNIRVLPFLKTMDKFTTFYVYIKRDPVEPKRLNGYENAQAILKEAVEILQTMVDENDPKPKYVNVEFTGYLSL